MITSPIQTRVPLTDAHYRWVVVAAGGLLGCVAIGAMFSLPVFLQPIARDTGWSVTGVSMAMTIAFIAMAIASMVWGSLSDRFGPRAVVLAGSIILTASLALASQTTSLLQFQLIFGLLIGGSTAAIFAPMMACVTGWFDTHPSQPCRFPGLSRHGHGAHDHVATRGVARLEP
jgi:MFS family permease